MTLSDTAKGVLVWAMMLWKRIVCSMFFHDLRVRQKFGPWSRRIDCVRCHRSWATNDDTRSFLEWSEDFEKLYADHGHKIV